MTNQVRTWVAAAACAGATLSAQAATPVTVELEGTITWLRAVTEVKGYNCSQYNPCNPLDPAAVTTDKFGNLVAGQGIKINLLVDPSSGLALTGAFVTADGSGVWGGANTYGLYTNSTDPYQMAYSMQANGASYPNTIRPNITWDVTPTGRLMGLEAALLSGNITGVRGGAQFDSCRMVQNYWGSACGGSLGLAFSKVAVNGQVLGAVPEPTTWALMSLGLLAMAWQVRQRQAQRPDSAS